MTAALLCGTLATGVWPAAPAAVGEAGHLLGDHHGYAAAVVEVHPVPVPSGPPPHWTGKGVVLGMLSAVLAAALAALAVRGDPAARSVPARLWAPVRRHHSGHVGDYAAWTVAGMALLALLTAPGAAL